MLLEIKGLTAHYDGVMALHGISLAVNEGERVALIGANGAGKTTTLMCISRIKRPSSGEIWFKGERIDGKLPNDIVRKGILQVPEGKRIFPAMTVLENLLVGAHTIKKRSEIESHLKNVYRLFPILEERKKQAGGTLSGGEQQMLTLARALMARPTLLLMDEPSFGLAPIIVQEIAKIMHDINKMGISILIVEQNVRLALSTTQRGYLLEMGKVVLEDNSKTLSENEQVRKAYLGL